jgi:hypothetical protein
MSSKGHLKLWGGMMVVLVSLAGGGWRLFSKWDLNKQNVDELKHKYAQAKVLDDKDFDAAARAAVLSQEQGAKEAPTLTMTFRAIGLNRVSPEADQEIAFNVLNGIKSSAYFDASKTEASDITAEVPLSDLPVRAGSGTPPGTFSFKIVAKLKRPLTL